MKIDCDAWLSDIFGYGVYRVNMGDSDGGGFESTAADLESLASHPGREERSFYYTRFPTEQVETLHALNPLGFNVVDVSVTFARKPAKQPEWTTGETEIVDDVLPEHHDAVLDIAGSSFTYSRFHLDPQIPVQTSNAIKRAWIGSYIKKKRGERLMVALTGNAPVGFLAVLASSFENKPCRIIDLVAVDTRYKGRGIGGALVSSFVQRYVDECDLLRVGTQAANVPSLRLYERGGFSVEQTAYVMHAHTDEGQVL